MTACVAQLKGVPVLVDSSAAMRPFAMAKALAEYGFQVGAVFITHGKEEDRAEREWLESNHPRDENHMGRAVRRCWGVAASSGKHGHWV